MKLLIDSQVFIWLINEDKKLNPKILELLQDSTNQLLISYFSFFEMAIKASIGKLNYDPKVLDLLNDMDIELVMPDTSLLKKYEIFNTQNKDPFDNALIATAIVGKYILVTSDHKILDTSFKGLKLLNANT